ncbi:MAG: DUF4139 domain-containing protein [Phycisphaeraceae bacterium]
MPSRMKSSMTLAAIAVGLMVAAGSTFAQEQQAPPEPAEVSVTVYSTADPAGFDPQQFIAQQRQGHNPGFAWQVPGFGVVKEVRPVEFDEGRNTIRFTDVAEFIDPTTVSFTDLTDPDATAVLEQQFLFDLVSSEKLLEKYVDQEITVFVPTGADGAMEAVEGTLLSAIGGELVLRTDAGIRLLRRSADTQVQLGELPGGLITRPTLAWLVNSGAAGQRQVRTTYQTAGITWRADYNLILDDDETSADLGAWVSLMNLSGATYENARLKLIAGDVQRIEPQRPQPMRMEMERAAAGIVQDQAFEQRPFFEYHLYTLPRPTTVAQNTTQQITLFPTAHDVAVEKVLVYYGLPESQHWGMFPQPRTDRGLGTEANEKVDVYLRFDNSEDNNLGMPMPAGKVRVFKEDPADETLEFVGEDLIDHTPRDEELLIKLGQSFDIVGERTQTNFTIDQRAHVMTETFRIQLRNHQDEPVQVLVKENLYRWVNWEITDASDDFEKIDARTIHFGVEVPAGGEKTVTYTVRYTW